MTVPKSMRGETHKGARPVSHLYPEVRARVAYGARAYNHDLLLPTRGRMWEVYPRMGNIW